MAHLPFLVVYGAWVWKIALVGLVALCFAAIAWVRRWIAQNDAAFAAGEHVANAYETADEAAAAAELAPGPVQLTGTLRGGSITRVSQRGRSVCRQGDGLWLEHGAERIPIAGTVQLEAGSAARASWFARHVPVPSMQARLRPTLVQTVADGDEIVVSGAVERVAAAASYREAPQGWRLVAPAGAAMRAWATSPRVRPLPLGPWRSAVIALAAGTLGWLGMVRVGAYLDHDDHGPHLDTPWSIELACALPGSRMDALDAFAGELAAHRRTDELLALYALVGQCPDEALADAGDFDGAIAAAKRCGDAKSARRWADKAALHAASEGQIDEAIAKAAAANDPRLAANLLAWAGRTDDAIAAATSAGDTGLAVALLVRTGRFDAAAPLLDTGTGSPLGAAVAIARGEWRRAVDELRKLSEVTRQEIHAECLEPLLLTRGGDPSAFDGSGQCGPYQLLAAELAGSGVATIAHVPGMVEERTLLLTGAHAVAGDRNRPMVMSPTFWLARFVPVADAAPQQAWIDLVRGDVAAARHALEVADPSGTAPYVAARVALHDGSTLPQAVALEAQELWWRLRAGEAISEKVLCTEELYDCPFGPGLQAAERGDGGPLAAAVRSYSNDWTTIADEVLAVAPRVTAHRAELAAALHTMSVETRGSIVDFIEDAAVRRDLAHLLGDEAAAAQWQAVVARFDAVLADRQKATALVLLGRP